MGSVKRIPETAAVRAAIELDLFTTIGEGGKEASEIARQCNASTRGIRILCDYLTVTGFLSKEGETYELVPTSAVFLNRHSPAYLGSMAQFLNSPQLMAGFANFTATVREGTTQLGRAGVMAPEYEGWITFAETMKPLIKGATEFIASELIKNGKKPQRVLEVAAGHGAFGIAIAQHVPEVEVVAQDWPNVLAVAERNAREAGVGQRFKMLPGDVLPLNSAKDTTWCS